MSPGVRTATGVGSLALDSWASWSDLLLLVWGHVVPGWAVRLYGRGAGDVVPHDRQREAYAVGRTGLAWGEAGSWVVDDGYRPVAGGTYKLDWERDGGLLLISGTSTDPVLRGGMTDIDCGW